MPVTARNSRTVWPNSLGPKKRKEAKEKKHDNTTPLGVCCIVIREIRENPVTKQGEKPQTTQKSHTLWCLREVHHIRYGLDDQPLHVWHHACNTVFLRFPPNSLRPPPLQGRKGKKGMVSYLYEPVTKRHSAVVCPDGTPDAVTINHATPQITLYSQDSIRSCHRVCSLKSNVADRATFTFGNHRFTIHRGYPERLWHKHRRFK